MPIRAGGSSFHAWYVTRRSDLSIPVEWCEDWGRALIWQTHKGFTAAYKNPPFWYYCVFELHMNLGWRQKHQEYRGMRLCYESELEHQAECCKPRALARRFANFVEKRSISASALARGLKAGGI